MRAEELTVWSFRKPLDVLAQQIAAEVASGEWNEEELYELMRRAWPYRDLTREEYGEVLQMLAEGFSTRRGRKRALIHRDVVNRKLRPRDGLRLTAVTSGGTIPDTADYSVVLSPQEITVGTVNEDFAVESLAGDVFQLGNTSYRILRVEAGRVRVEDAEGRRPRFLSGSGKRRRAVTKCLPRYRDCEPMSMHGYRIRKRRSTIWPEKSA
jgi:ATP-dependent Lhr-like helicase